MVKRGESSGTLFASCAGVWVSPTEILTAGHCVSHDEDEESPIGDQVHYIIQKEVRDIYLEPSANHLGFVKAVDTAHDLALIKVVESGMPLGHEAALLAGEMPAVGEVVHMMGHPTGLYWTFTTGTVAGYRMHPAIGSAIQIDGTIWYGNSGGGLFDESGHLLGICSRLGGMPNMSYFVHLDNIKAFLEKK